MREQRRLGGARFAETRLAEENGERVAADEPESSSVSFSRPKKKERASSVNDARPGHGFSRSTAAVEVERSDVRH